MNEQAVDPFFTLALDATLEAFPEMSDRITVLHGGLRPQFWCCGAEIPDDYPPEGNVAECPSCWHKHYEQRFLAESFHRRTWEHRLICRILGCCFR